MSLVSSIEAESAITEIARRKVHPPGDERVPIEQAQGRILADDVVSDRDGPPYDRATKDGIAVRSAAVNAGHTHFRSLGVLAAGADPERLAPNSADPDRLQPDSRTPDGSAPDRLDPDSTRPSNADQSQPLCVEIMTGSVVPSAFDAIIPYEALEQESISGETCFRITDPTFEGRSAEERDDRRLEDRAAINPGFNIHSRGSDYRRGDVLLARGSRIGSSAVAVLASCGADPVPVHRPPAIAVLATGDELVDVHETPRPYQIRASNHLSLCAELAGWGFPPAYCAFVDDDPAVLSERISALLETYQVLILSGAVSRGLYDSVPRLLQELGVEIRVHGVRQRPGKPLLIGESGRNLVVGLPGNPVSSLVSLRRYLIPALMERFSTDTDNTTDTADAADAPHREITFNAQMQETTPRDRSGTPGGNLIEVAARGLDAILSEPISFSMEFTYFPAVRLLTQEMSGGEALRVAAVAGNGSGDFLQLADSAGFVEIAAQQTTVPAGEHVTFYPWAVR